MVTLLTFTYGEKSINLNIDNNFNIKGGPMNKKERIEITHNTTKVKSLLFLQMVKKVDDGMATAREIAQAITVDDNGAIPKKAKSLYVLLERWARWGYVARVEVSPFAYMIQPEGERYLSKIGAWFFGGYHSRKRGRRVLGYRGTAEDLNHQIAAAAKAVVWAFDYHKDAAGKPQKDERGFPMVKELLYFEAPFNSSKDFHRLPVESRHIQWAKERLFVVKADNICAAYNLIKSWGCFNNKSLKKMGQPMVDAGFASWDKDE